MFRDESTISIRTKVSDLKDRKTLDFTRPQKGSEEFNKLKEQKERTLKSIDFLERQYNERKSYAKDEYLETLQKAINSKKEDIEIIDMLLTDESKNNPSHKTLKRKIKKRTNVWIKEQVLSILKEDKEESIPYLMKEDIARILEVKECQVEQVFMELNREGYLSQAKHKAPT